MAAELIEFNYNRYLRIVGAYHALTFNRAIRLLQQPIFYLDDGTMHIQSI